MTGVPRPKSYHESALGPDNPVYRKGLNEIKNMFNAFHKYSETFSINFCDIRPMLGDFKITNRWSGESSHVESKTEHCRLIRDEQKGILSLQHLHGWDPTSYRGVFTWKAQWDYLYSHIRSDSTLNQALFVPRDSIPKSWWNYPRSNEPDWLDWPADYGHRFEEYLVNTTPNRRLVEEMETILTRNLKKAQDPISMVSMGSAALMETGNQLGIDQSFFAEEPWDSSEYRRGHGSAAHPELKGETYHMWASEVLLELCRAR